MQFNINFKRQNLYGIIPKDFRAKVEYKLDSKFIEFGPHARPLLFTFPKRTKIHFILD